MLTEAIFIVLVFSILALIGVILWKASEPAVYDPDDIVKKGEFDPHHHHYTPHQQANASQTGDKKSPDRSRNSALSASARMAEPSWLTETTSAVEKPLQSAGRRDQRQERRVWDRRINQEPVSNDRRNNDRRTVPVYA